MEKLGEEPPRTRQLRRAAGLAPERLTWRKQRCRPASMILSRVISSRTDFSSDRVRPIQPHQKAAAAAQRKNPENSFGASGASSEMTPKPNSAVITAIAKHDPDPKHRVQRGQFSVNGFSFKTLFRQAVQVPRGQVAATNESARRYRPSSSTLPAGPAHCGRSLRSTRPNAASVRSGSQPRSLGASVAVSELSDRVGAFPLPTGIRSEGVTGGGACGAACITSPYQTTDSVETPVALAHLDGMVWERVRGVRVRPDAHRCKLTTLIVGHETNKDRSGGLVKCSRSNPHIMFEGTGWCPAIRLQDVPEPFCQGTAQIAYGQSPMNHGYKYRN